MLRLPAHKREANMKNIKSTARTLSAAAFGTALVLTPPKLVNAEDIDLFVSAAAVAATSPNVLIIIDNSANWNSAAQHWDANLKQGQSELRAINTVLSNLDGNNPKINLGLMMFRSGSPDGGIVRFGIRPMNTTNINAFKELLGPLSGCTAGNNSLNGTPNCIAQNYSGTGVEQTNSSSTNYSGALMDAYKYFGGYTSPTYALSDQQPPGALNDATHHGQRRYFDSASALPTRADAAAYSADALSYVSPITSPCAKNYIIFIGNGFPSNDANILGNVNEGASPQTPTQLAVPGFTTIASTTTTTLGTDSTCEAPASCASALSATYGTLYDSYACSGGNTVANTTTLGTDTVCESTALCVTRATTTFPSPPNSYTSYSCSGGVGTGDTFVYNVCSDAASCAAAGPTVFPGYNSYSCDNSGTSCGAGNRTGRVMTGTVTSCSSPSRKNQTMSGVNASITACLSPNALNQTQQGTKTVNQVTPLTTFCTPGTAGCVPVNNADEWARFLYTTDVSSLLGQQNVFSCTIDVFKDLQASSETALLFNMAKYGGGRYFQATDENSIVSALNQILIEVQSVNSAVASASLPISSTNNSPNENQIYIGMFRPDGSGNPRWYGNLKRYQFAQFGPNDVRPADASTPPQDLVSGATGFVSPCAVSFWTQDSGPYWLFQNGSAGQCTTAGTAAVFSDAPDGPLVEKGAAAEVLRRGNNPPTTAGVPRPAPGVNRTNYTCGTGAPWCPH